MSDFNQYLQFQKELTLAKLRVIEQLQKSGNIPSVKRTSKTEIVEDILKSQGRPLHVTEIINIAKKERHIDLDRDSIVSILIKKMKAGKMITRTAPNTFSFITQEDHPNVLGS